MTRAILNGTAAGVVMMAIACGTELPRDAAVSRTEPPPGGEVGATMSASTVTMAGGAARDSIPGHTAGDQVTGLAPDMELVVPLPPPRAAADSPPLTADADELQELSRGMLIPVRGILATDLRDSYTESRGGRVHEAIDIHAPRGTAVMAATDGRLLKLFDSRAGGLMVYAADAGDRFIFMYGHLDRYAPGAREGMPLRRGQLIGYVGTTGNASQNAPHLHLAIARGRPSAAWWRGTPVNPYPLFVRPR